MIKHYIIKCVLFLFCLLCMFQIDGRAQKGTDTLLLINLRSRLSEIVADDTTSLNRRFNLNKEIAYIYLEQNNTRLALSYFIRALKESSALEKSDTTNYAYKLKAAKILSDVAYLYWMRGNYSDAYKNYIRASEKMQFLHNTMPDSTIFLSKIASYENSIGAIEWGRGSYKNALKHYSKSLKIRRQIADSVGIVLVLNNIGLVYLDWDKTEYVKSYFEDGLRISKEIDYAFGEAYSKFNLGKVYQKFGEYKTALALYKQVNKSYLEQNKMNGVCESLIYIGSIYEIFEQPKKAVQNYKSAFNIATSNNRTRFMAQAATKIGNIYLNMNNLAEAQKHIEKGIELSETNNYQTLLKDNYYNRYKLFKEFRNYKNALADYQRYTQIKDSVFSEKSMKQVEEMKAKYETEKTEKENQILKKDVQLKQSQIAMRENVIWFSIIAVVLVTLLAFTMYSSRQKHKKNNALLEKMNNEIRKKNNAITAQAARLKVAVKEMNRLMDFKQNMTSMIVHDLKNPLSAILRQNLSMSKDWQLETARNSARQMLNMVLNILDIQRFESFEVKLNRQKTALYSIAQAACKNVSFLCEEKNIEIHNNIPEIVKVTVDTGYIERVFINLLTNAIKFSPVNEIVSIEAKKDNNRVVVSITDFGEGIPQEQQQFVFQKFKQLKTKKSGGVISSGLGLAFCKVAIETHGGKIGVESRQSEFTRFWFSLKAEYSNTESNTENKTTQIVKKKKQVITFSQSERSYLNNYYDKLVQHQLYEISSIHKILKLVDEKKSVMIALWKRNINNAVTHQNNDEYNRLLAMIE